MTIPAKDEARAREMLAHFYERDGSSDVAAAFRAGKWTCHDHPAYLAILAYASEREREAIERAAKVAVDGFRCATCGVTFIGEDGHPVPECARPDWWQLTDEEKASAIRRLSQKGGE